MFTCKDLHSTRLSSGPPLAGDAPILASDDSQRLVGKASRNRICFFLGVTFKNTAVSP